MKSGRWFGRITFWIGLELPFSNAGPILGALFIELLFPFCLRVLAILADMVTLMASGTIAALYIVVELTLRFRGNFVPVDDGVRIRSFEALGKVGGFFMVGASCEMEFSSRLVAFVLPRSLLGIRGTLGFIFVF